MNRLSWDSTAPRRMTRKRAEQRRTDDDVVAAEAELIRVAWAEPRRVGPF